MALKKSQLYSSIWESCNALRGGMDASQYKDYVLTLLFMKYVTDKYSGDPYSLLEIPEGGDFNAMRQLTGKKNIGEGINTAISRFAEANELKGVVDQADFDDDSKLGSGNDKTDKLSKLITIFDRLDLGANTAEGDDLMGDAYEYLMRHFASEAGKSKGQFYTPAEVSTVMAKVLGIGPQTAQDESVYDPTCGSGSLLLKAANEAPTGMSIFGQEFDNATWALGRMNMILHDYPTAYLWNDNTLANPHFTEKDGSLMRFDYAVANPPFSYKSWTNGVSVGNDEYERFEFGTPPPGNGDYAFLLHLLKSLKSTGKGAIILPHGVLFRANKEAEIRQELVRRGYIKGIIGLPPNLFYGTGIPASIILLDKAQAAEREHIFMVDASKGYIKDGNKNRLRERDIRQIVDVVNRELELPGYSRSVPLSEISSEANAYNLNLPRYIDTTEPEDHQDLEAHLKGGIPKRDIDDLQEYWDVFPSLRDELFREGDRPGYLTPKLPPEKVKPAITANPDFQRFSETVDKTIGEWMAAHRDYLANFDQQDGPKEVIRKLAEDLFERFDGNPLIDPYAIYQQLMTYWDEQMQDDTYLIIADGWWKAAQPRKAIEDKERKIKETPDLEIGGGKSKKKYKTDLIPPYLIIDRYFAADKARLEELEAQHEQAERDFNEFAEEHGADEALLEDVTNDNGNITKGAVKERLKAIGANPGEDLQEEYQALNQCLKLIEKESRAKKALNDHRKNLDLKVFGKYEALSGEEVKTLVVEDKWLTDVKISIEEEVSRVTQQLAGRIQELEVRYSEPLPDLEEEVTDYSQKVEEHLKTMGVQ
jgi:type I restriction enzyme M protein